MVTNTRKLLSKESVLDPTNNLIDIRLFGSVLSKPRAECNDIDVLLVVKDSNCGTLDLKLRNGIHLTSQELNTPRGKFYTKSTKTSFSNALPLHIHHCSINELKLNTPFCKTFKQNNISIWND